MRSDPDWTGRWRNSQTERHSAIARKSSSWASNGWLVVNRTRSMEVFASIARRRAGKSTRRDPSGPSEAAASGRALELEQGSPPARADPAGPVGEALAVGVHVLPEERDLAIARAHQLLDLVEDLLERPRDLLATRRRHDAVGALLVAAFHDRHERRDAARPVVGRRPAVERPHLPVDREDPGARAEPPLLAALGDAGQEIRQIVDLRRPRHQVDLRQAAEDLLALRLGHAAEDAQDEARALALELLHEPHLPERALLGVGADRAGIEEDDVRLLLAFDDGVALGHEHSEDLLGVPLVHLAAVGLEVHRLGHGGPDCTPRPVGECPAGGLPWRDE